ncbi:MAG TPA: hypothetical protein VH413_15215 [Verrucomicrobiae bacterium]|jgi:hypothetical protein|nr:hypothetical protein [Verrucomicrobiae bacterium]
MPLQYPADYDTGYIGFTCAPGIAYAGIAYAEHWHRLGRVPVTHTFIVTGNNECVEAHIDEGVARVPLDKYLRDPACRTYFRRPRAWTPSLGARIATAAASRIGARYNTSLILAQATADTWLGHWCNRIFRDWPNRVFSQLLNRRDHWICSQLVAYALAQQPEFANNALLRQPLDTIDPQQLFDDQSLYEAPPQKTLAA